MHESKTTNIHFHDEVCQVIFFKKLKDTTTEASATQSKHAYIKVRVHKLIIQSLSIEGADEIRL